MIDKTDVGKNVKIVSNDDSNYTFGIREGDVGELESYDLIPLVDVNGGIYCFLPEQLELV